MRTQCDLCVAKWMLLIAFVMIPMAGCVPYNWTTVSTHWMAGPGDVDFTFKSHWESRASFPIAYGVGGSMVKSEMYVRQKRGPWQLLFMTNGGVLLPEMGADETGLLWIRWDEHWKKTDIHVPPSQRPATLNQLVRKGNSVEVVPPAHSYVRYLNRGDDDLLPSVTPFGTMNDDDGKRIEWSPDMSGRFMKWRESDKIPFIAMYRPGFKFDRIDRRHHSQLIPGAFMYVLGEDVVGVYWRTISWRPKEDEYSHERVNHIVAWIERGRIVRVELEPPTTKYPMRSARRTFTGLSVMRESLLRSNQQDDDGSWLSADSTMLEKLIVRLLDPSSENLHDRIE